mmetsp:Transcript_130032/g.229815  ORF Transcript_130032/g.229815 Transcript_130032/m.229815 type:complete len:121 (+) Transcript_130032:72-434(+)
MSLYKWNANAGLTRSSSFRNRPEAKSSNVPCAARCSVSESLLTQFLQPLENLGGKALVLTLLVGMPLQEELAQQTLLLLDRGRARLKDALLDGSNGTLQSLIRTILSTIWKVPWPGFSLK